MHAVGESSKEPVPKGTHAVVVAVASEDNLRALAAKLKSKAIPFEMIEEVDDPYSGQATAIGVHPVCDRREILKLVSSLPLYAGSSMAEHSE